MTIRRVVVAGHLCGVVVLLPLACSTPSVKGNPDAGGKADGGGVVDGGALTLPGCVSQLLSACPPVAPCAYSVGDGGAASVCFAVGADGGTGTDGGARATFTSVSPSLSIGGGSIVTVTKADGSPCYSFEYLTPTQYDDMVRTWTWKDATGRLVASGTLSLTPGPAAGEYSNVGVITCADGGAKTSCSYVLSTPMRCCDVSSYGAAACPDGVNFSATCVVGDCL